MEVQRTEWGDAIPLLRSFNHDAGYTVVNISYAGIVFEGQRFWELDPRTLDVIAQVGWGPGLTIGEFAEVQVKGADGLPVEGAEVWASGRQYSSFPLPDRPYLTNNKGIIRVPLGVDKNRIMLGLRAKTGNELVSPAVRFPLGAPPKEISLTLTESETIGGQVFSGGGTLLTNTWIYLSNDRADLDKVKSDAHGHWTAHLAQDDLAGLQGVPAHAGIVAWSASPAPVDPAAALRGEAVITANSFLPGESPSLKKRLRKH